MSKNRLCRAYLTEESHKIAKAEASLEGMPLSKWLDDIVKKEAKKKGRGKDYEMGFF